MIYTSRSSSSRHATGDGSLDQNSPSHCTRICNFLISSHLPLLLHHSTLKFSSTCFHRSAVNISARICNYFFTTPVWSFPSAPLASITVPSPSQHCNGIAISALQCQHGTTTHSSRCYRHPFTEVCSHRLTTALLPHIHHGVPSQIHHSLAVIHSPQHCLRTFTAVLQFKTHHSTAIIFPLQYCSQNLATILLRQIHYRTAAMNSAHYYYRHSPLTTALPPHLHRGTAVKPHLNTTATNPLQYCSYKLTAVLRSHIHRRPQYCHHIFTAVLQSTSP